MNTRKIESGHFQFFRKLLSNFPNGEVWHEDKPDFWIHTSDGILGIEHCLVHIPNSQRTPLQAIESQIDEIISMAQEHFELQGMPEIHATFLFNKFNTLKKKQRIDLARDIVRIICNRIPDNENEPFKRFEIRKPDLPEQLSLIDFRVVKEEMRNFWRCARAGWVLTDCKELLQKSINEKAEKYSSYIKNCNSCWLLMVAAGEPSSFIHPNQDSIDHKYYSLFERTYFLDCAQGDLFLLKTYNRRK